MVVGARGAFSVGVALALAAGCVSSPTIEDEVPPSVGAVQPPSSGGATLGADEACQKLVAAERATRDKLGCDDSAVDLSCPGHVLLVGATPCDEYDEGTVQACVDAIGGYAACSDFAAKPCVVTVDRASCHAPTTTEDAGAEAGRPDSSVAVPDGGSPVEAGTRRDAGPVVDSGAPADARGSSDAGSG